MSDITKKETQLVPRALDVDTVKILRTTAAKDLTDPEFKAFLAICQRKNLDPLVKHIYAVKRGGQMIVQVGIDGLRAIAARSGLYAGSDVEYLENEGKLVAAKCTVWRLAKKDSETRYPFSAVAHMSEYKPSVNDFMWKKMPHAMIAKCAESLALRKAFPEDVAGLYSTEEMEQSEPV
jgi:phage recombination protein Bet